LKSKIFFVFIFYFPLFVFTQRNSDKLTYKIDSIIQNLERLKSNEERVHNLVEGARKYSYVRATKKLFDKAIAISEQTKEKRLLIQSYYSLGNYYYFNSKLDSALLYNEKAYEKLKNDDFPFLKVKVLNYKGSIYAKQGNIIAGISMMLESKNLLRKIDTSNFTKEKIQSYKGQNLVLYNSLANFYNQMDDYESALFYYDEAYKAALNMGAIVNAGIIMSNKGDLLLNFNRIPEAIQALELGKKLKIDGNAHPRSMASSDLNIAKAYLKNNDYENSFLFLKKVHDYYITNNLNNMLALTYDISGELFLKQKKYKKAIIDCEKAQRLAKEYEDLETYMNACNCLYKANKELNRYDASLLNHEKYLVAKDSLFNEKNVKKQTQLEMQFAFDKKQEAQNVEVSKRDKERKLFLILAIIGLLIASLLLFLYSKNRNKNRLLATQKNLLEKTVGEKNVLLKETHHRVKNSFQIVSGLLFLQASNIKDKFASKALMETQNRINSMAVLHQKLYKQDHTSGVDCKDYITALIADILSSYSLPNIEKRLNLSPIIMDVEVVTSIGLIINELVTNSLKYAFPKKRENDYIEITLCQKKDTIILEVIDNGKGIAKGDDEKDSLGLSLVKDLAEKINGKISFKFLQNHQPKGTKVTLVLNKKDVLI
jgi:two-component sensor histidine kinase